MIPILYEATETQFASNGLGRLRDTITAVVSEERNGVYELTLEYPQDGAHYDLLEAGRIIAVTHDESGDVEPFDIVGITRQIDGVVTIHAVHVSYRLTGITCYGTNINTVAGAFSMFAGAEPSNPFTFTSDITTTAYMASADGTPRSVRQFMGGIEGSLLDTYGGEYSYNRFSVALNSARGVQRSFAIRYGVNLTDYNEESDYTSTYTSCVPYWTGTDENGDPLVIKGSRVDSGEPSYNGRNICVPLDLTDKFENKPTAAQLQTEAAAVMTAKKSNLPAQTIEVSFARLQDMGYSDLAPLMACNLCDTITVYFPFGNTSGLYKIVRTDWDVLQERYQSMTLGTLSTSLAEALGISNDLDKNDSVAQFVPVIETFSDTASNFTSGTSLHSLGVNQTMSAGKWVVLAACRYASNATGYRAIQITADGTGQNVSLMQTPAGGTGNVDLVTAAIIDKAASWTLDVNGRQNSGSSMNVDWYVKAIKVGA